MNFENLKLHTVSAFTILKPIAEVEAAVLDRSILTDCLKPDLEVSRLVPPGLFCRRGDDEWIVTYRSVAPHIYHWECRDAGGMPLAAGEITLSTGPGSEGTEVHLEAGCYKTFGKAAERSIARVTRGTFAFGLHEGLRRFKALLEAGEIPTIKGQSTGAKN